MTKIKAALIDMDGTLYDSMPFHARAWHRMVTELGLDATVDEFFGYEGMTGKATINLIFNRAYGRDATEQEVEELYHRKTVYFNEYPPVLPMPGADRMLRALHNAGVECVLVTGSGQSSLLRRLDTDYPGIFAANRRITARDVSHGKPHPEPYLKAMELVGAKPDECIVIENAPLGVESGAASGAFTVAVTTGPIEREKMVAAGADIIFDSMNACADDMPRLLDQHS